MRRYLVLDACVLMSGLLRPWLLKLANEALFQPIWSDKIGCEWQRNASRLWPIKQELLANAWQQMNTQFPEANIDIWPERRAMQQPPVMTRTDHKDHHVVHAAWKVKQHLESADVSIVTMNIKDFNRCELRSLKLNLLEPDRLLDTLWADCADILFTSLDETVDDLVRTGRREAAPLEDFLRRERLFRIRKKLMQVQ
jgi:hypothetical protein